MGHSPRLVESNLRARQAREWADLMGRHKPDSLTPAEVDLQENPLTKAPKPRPVLAWVRYAGRGVQVKGFATMWTDQAIKIRWFTPQLAWHEAWVWEGAARPRRMEQSEENSERIGLSVNAPKAWVDRA